VNPLTLPTDEESALSETELGRQAARDEMPSVESMLLLQDFETWAERVLSNTAWAYYRSATDEERSKLSLLLSNIMFFSSLQLKQRLDGLLNAYSVL
jgi:hypothetical protein